MTRRYLSAILPSMSLQPVGERCLVRPFPDLATIGGLVIPETAARLGCRFAEVLALPSGKGLGYKGSGDKCPTQGLRDKPWPRGQAAVSHLADLEVGQVVMLQDHGGTVIQVDGEDCLAVLMTQIFLIVEGGIELADRMPDSSQVWLAAQGLVS